MSRSPLPSRVCLSFALLLGACTGQISQGGGGGPPASGAAGATAPGSAGGGGTPGAAGAAGSIATGAAGGVGSAGAPAPAPGTDPGRVTMHRLNRVEYNNTVRDLFGTTARP